MQRIHQFADVFNFAQACQLLLQQQQQQQQQLLQNQRKISQAVRQQQEQQVTDSLSFSLHFHKLYGSLNITSLICKMKITFACLSNQ